MFRAFKLKKTCKDKIEEIDEQLIKTHKLDVFAKTETWLKPSDCVRVNGYRKEIRN